MCAVSVFLLLSYQLHTIKIYEPDLLDAINKFRANRNIDKTEVTQYVVRSLCSAADTIGKLMMNIDKPLTYTIVY